MATDPGTLLAQANCYACFGIGGTWRVLELALLAQWSAETNLIPVGATYPNNGVYGPIALVSGQSYHITLITPIAGNDQNASYSHSTQNIQIVGPVTNFQFTPITFGATCQITLTGGLSLQPVTCILVTP